MFTVLVQIRSFLLNRLLVAGVKMQ